eukprot:g3082.t1
MSMNDSFFEDNDQSNTSISNDTNNSYEVDDSNHEDEGFLTNIATSIIKSVKKLLPQVSPVSPVRFRGLDDDDDGTRGFGYDDDNDDEEEDNDHMRLEDDFRDQGEEWDAAASDSDVTTRRSSPPFPSSEQQDSYLTTERLQFLHWLNHSLVVRLPKDTTTTTTTMNSLASSTNGSDDFVGGARKVFLENLIADSGGREEGSSLNPTKAILLRKSSDGVSSGNNNQNGNNGGPSAGESTSEAVLVVAKALTKAFRKYRKYRHAKNPLHRKQMKSFKDALKKFSITTRPANLRTSTTKNLLNNPQSLRLLEKAIEYVSREILDETPTMGNHHWFDNPGTTQASKKQNYQTGQSSAQQNQSHKKDSPGSHESSFSGKNGSRRSLEHVRSTLLNKIKLHTTFLEWIHSESGQWRSHVIPEHDKKYDAYNEMPRQRHAEHVDRKRLRNERTSKYLFPLTPHVQKARFMLTLLDMYETSCEKGRGGALNNNNNKGSSDVMDHHPKKRGDNSSLQSLNNNNNTGLSLSSSKTSNENNFLGPILQRSIGEVVYEDWSYSPLEIAHAGLSPEDIFFSQVTTSHVAFLPRLLATTMKLTNPGHQRKLSPMHGNANTAATMNQNSQRGKNGRTGEREEEGEKNRDFILSSSNGNGFRDNDIGGSGSNNRFMNDHLTKFLSCCFEINRLLICLLRASLKPHSLEVVTLSSSDGEDKRDANGVELDGERVSDSAITNNAVKWMFPGQTLSLEMLICYIEKIGFTFDSKDFKSFNKNVKKNFSGKDWNNKDSSNEDQSISWMECLHPSIATPVWPQTSLLVSIILDYLQDDIISKLTYCRNDVKLRNHLKFQQRQQKSSTTRATLVRHHLEIQSAHYIDTCDRLLFTLLYHGSEFAQARALVLGERHQHWPTLVDVCKVLDYQSSHQAKRNSLWKFRKPLTQWLGQSRVLTKEKDEKDTVESSGIMKAGNNRMRLSAESRKALIENTMVNQQDNTMGNQQDNTMGNGQDNTMDLILSTMETLERQNGDTVSGNETVSKKRHRTRNVEKTLHHSVNAMYKGTERLIQYLQEQNRSETLSKQEKHANSESGGRHHHGNNRMTPGIMNNNADIVSLFFNRRINRNAFLAYIVRDAIQNHKESIDQIFDLPLDIVGDSLWEVIRFLKSGWKKAQTESGDGLDRSAFRPPIRPLINPHLYRPGMSTTRGFGAGAKTPRRTQVRTAQMRSLSLYEFLFNDCCTASLSRSQIDRLTEMEIIHGLRTGREKAVSYSILYKLKAYEKDQDRRRHGNIGGGGGASSISILRKSAKKPHYRSRVAELAAKKRLQLQALGILASKLGEEKEGNDGQSSTQLQQELRNVMVM